MELHESFSSHGNFLSHTICLVLYRVHAKEQGDPVGSLCQNNIIVVDIDRWQILAPPQLAYSHKRHKPPVLEWSAVHPDNAGLANAKPTTKWICWWLHGTWGTEVSHIPWSPPLKSTSQKMYHCTCKACFSWYEAKRFTHFIEDYPQGQLSALALLLQRPLATHSLIQTFVPYIAPTIRLSRQPWGLNLVFSVLQKPTFERV